MSNVIQFPSRYDRVWREVAEGMRSGLLASGYSSEEIGRIEGLMQPAWDSVFSAIKDDGISMYDLQNVLFGEFLRLALQVERGYA